MRDYLIFAPNFTYKNRHFARGTRTTVVGVPIVFTKELMKMYPYHNRILQRIKNGEYIGFEFCDDGEFAVILKFSTPPFTRPIRPHAVWRYEEILRG